MPPPPPELKPPVMWGEEEHVRSLFAGSGAELAFERRTVTFTHDSPRGLGRLQRARARARTIMAKAALEPQGRYEELRGELTGAMYSAANEARRREHSARRPSTC